METLTLFIDHLYNENLGATEFQTIRNRNINDCDYNNLTISGNLFKDIIFENIIFNNCHFMGTTLENCLFINCLFINCTFQFSRFNDCNFELTCEENCKWGYVYESGHTTSFPLLKLQNFCA